jgi:eukaryotic-like serine/threonine-protein kinase
MIGKTILHYKIIEKLGEGGMGVVYLAEDTNLERKVAIKFLPHHISDNSDERKRFEIEAKAAAALNHPNISTIHAIEEADDELFIVMEYIEGDELKEKLKSGPLTIEESINIANQIGEGLQSAHEKTITHRDIKSSNIMITKDGKVKIMDFGLAKVGKGMQLTKEQSTLGTAAYMSPEQARGDVVDHRTDIWSFGVVLYEMLIGQVPFKGDYEQAVIYSILNIEPEYPENLDPYLVSILKKMISKKVEIRYRNLDELLYELESIKSGKNVSGELKQKLSIAVLPFSDLSPHKDQEYFCDGMAEEILNIVSKIESLQVPSRISSFQFRNNNFDLSKIQEKLKVNYFLEGSVRKSGDRIRVTVQLIDVKNDAQIWSDRYDRKLEDVFEVQDDITEKVVTSLKGVLTPDEKQKIQRPETSIEAYEYFLKGRQLLNQVDFAAARETFKTAIEKDPQYAAAHAGLANTFSHIFEWFGRNKEDLKAAETHSKKALELAENHSESHTALGFALSTGGNYEMAEKEFLRAIELDSNSYDAHYLFARMSFSKGDIERASEFFLKASEIRKDDVQSASLLALTYNAIGSTDEYESTLLEVIKRAENQLALNPTDRRTLSLGALALLENGQKEKAFAWQEKVLKLYPDELSLLMNATCFYATAGESEKAIDFLEKFVDKGFGSLNWIENDPDYDSLRKHPRFIELMKNLK